MDISCLAVKNMYKLLTHKLVFRHTTSATMPIRVMISSDCSIIISIKSRTIPMPVQVGNQFQHDPLKGLTQLSIRFELR